MCRMDERRWLPALAVFAALVPLSLAVFAQPPLEPQTAPQQSVRVIAAPATQPTPEEIGDALMIHQRYQAAIAAYQKAPANSASAMNKMGIAYQMMFSLNDALRCYQASLKMDPRNSHVYNNLGAVYDGLREYRQSPAHVPQGAQAGSQFPAGAEESGLRPVGPAQVQGGLGGLPGSPGSRSGCLSGPPYHPPRSKSGLDRRSAAP